MQPVTTASFGAELLGYWSRPELTTNLLVLLHLMGATAIGTVIGYERSYTGRAAGMRTYGLVCLSACLLTVIGAYPTMWFGGTGSAPASVDPTRTIQGIVTGIGFLCAGVIMKEGFTIRGLSTAASIWTTSAIGVTIGVGFYAAALGATVLCILVMSLLKRLEVALPHRTLSHLTLIARRDTMPTQEEVVALVAKHRYEVMEWAFHRQSKGDRFECQVVLCSTTGDHSGPLAGDLAVRPEIVEYRITPSRL